MAKINEIGDTEKGQYALGRLRARKFKKDGFKKGNEVGKYAEKAREKSSLYTKTVDGCNDTFYSPNKYKELTDAHANGWHDEIHRNESKEMKNAVKLIESDLHAIVEDAARNILKEYGNLPQTREKMGMAAKRGIMKGDTSAYDNAMNSLGKRNSLRDDYNDFQKGFEGENLNAQPGNNLVGEMKVNESQLYDIIRESVRSILAEIGDTHRFGMGKFGLAKDAASKARSLGRRDQADNLESYGADAFNSEYGTDDFGMDEYGQLRHRGKDGKERMYRPQSSLRSLEKQRGLQGGQDRYDNALRNNSFIKNSAQVAKAFPRKKMTGGLNAIDTVDKGIHGEA